MRAANAAKCPGDGERAPRLARRSRTVKINSEGRHSQPGVASRCGHGSLPGAAKRLGKPEIVAARLAGDSRARRTGQAARHREASRPLLCVAVCT